MKANSFFILAMSASIMLLGSCKNDELQESLPEAKTSVDLFTAGMEAGNVTRTHLGGSENNNVWWQHDDGIAVFSDASIGSNRDKYGWAGYTSSGDSTSCSFVSASSGVTAGNHYYALYPYQADATLQNAIVKGVVFPSEQTAVEGTYDRSAAIMVATSTTKNLQFNNVNSMIKVTPTVDCSRIIITSIGGEALAGTIDITPSAIATENSEYYSLKSGTGRSSVTLSGCIEAGKTYYISVLPQTCSSGFYVTFIKVLSDDQGRLGLQKYKNSAFTFARSRMVDFGELGAANMELKSNASLNTALNLNLPEVNCPIIDLGLTSNGKPLMWAKYNVGTSAERPLGDFFAWGETSPYYTDYTIDFVHETITIAGWKDGKSDGYTNSSYPYYNGASEVSPYIWTEKTLNKDNDAAYMNMESPLNASWRMPTLAEYVNLKNNTVVKYGNCNFNGINVPGYFFCIAKKESHKGCIYCKGVWYKAKDYDHFYEPNAHNIKADETLTAELNAYTWNSYLFIPKVMFLSGKNKAGSEGHYWTSSYNNATSAYMMKIGYDFLFLDNQIEARCDGLSVRAVCQN